MALSPDQLEMLHAAVVAAFSPDELAVLVRFKPGVRLDAIVNPNAATPKVVLDLLDYVEKRNWTEEFIRGVYAQHPEQPLVRQFCEADAPYVFQASPTTEKLAQAVGEGLASVADRLGEARDSIRQVIAGEARTQLAELGRQFSRIRRYKILHHCLHNLQFKYVRLIKSELLILRENQDEADNLLILFAEMTDELTDCGPEIRGLPSDMVEQMWLNVAGESVRRLRVGDTSNDLAGAGVGLQMLEGLLRVQPTRINLLLTGSLEALRFEHLLSVFSQLRERVAGGRGWVASLSTATSALGSLAPRLNRVLSDHKDWQLVDNNLLQIETDLKLGAQPEQSDFLWHETDRILAPLLDQERDADWSRELRQLAGDLSGALQQADSKAASKAFNRLRPRAMWYFYQADKELKDLATDLDAVGLKLERFTLGLRTRRTGEARLFRLKSEFRLQPESKPL